MVARWGSRPPCSHIEGVAWTNVRAGAIGPANWPPPVRPLDAVADRTAQSQLKVHVESPSYASLSRFGRAMDPGDRDYVQPPDWVGLIYIAAASGSSEFGQECERCIHPASNLYLRPSWAFVATEQGMVEPSIFRCIVCAATNMTVPNLYSCQRFRHP